MPHILVAGSIHPKGVALLEASGMSFELVGDIEVESYAPLLPKADALVIRTQPLTAEVIATADRLRIVSRHGVGYDAVDAGALARKGIPLCVVGDVNSRSVAEHALWLMLSATRLSNRGEKAVREGTWEWRNAQEASEIAGKSLLIVGLGRIGRRLADYATAFDMEIRAYDPYLAEHGWPAGPVGPAENLEDGLAWADFVSIHTPLSDQPLIGEAELKKMKPTAVIVNAARGGIIDETALARALSDGTIRAAGLDVFDREPPDPGNPLLALDNIVLSPHNAGLMREGAERLAIHSVQNVLDFFARKLDPALIVNGVHTNA